VTITVGEIAHDERTASPIKLDESVKVDEPFFALGELKNNTCKRESLE